MLSTICSACDQEDAFVWLLTGFGKSTQDSVQVFTFLFDHKLNRLDGPISSIVLVVTPLVALLIDQVITNRAY